MPTAPAFSRTASQAAGPITDVEVCGLGRYKSTTSEMALDAGARSKLAQARADNLQRLRTVGTERARAAELMLRTLWAKEAERQEADEASYNACRAGDPASNPASSAACAAATSHEARVIQAYETEAAATVAQLADIASRSSDAGVYAQGLQACQRLSTANRPAVCDTISFAQWARLDPSNMVPWIWLTDQAQSQKNPGAVSEALYRASLSTSSDGYMGLVATELSRVAEPGVSQLAAFYQGRMVMYVWALPAYQPMRAMCTKSAAKDANRRQVCEKVIAGMVSHSDTLIGALVGLRMGEDMGWDTQVVTQLRNQLRAQEDAYQAANYLQQRDDSVQSLGCDSVTAKLNHLARIDQIGEWATVRETAAAGGSTVQALTAAYVAKRQAQRAAQPTNNPAP